MLQTSLTWAALHHCPQLQVYTEQYQLVPQLKCLLHPQSHAPAHLPHLTQQLLQGVFVSRCCIIHINPPPRLYTSKVNTPSQPTQRTPQHRGLLHPLSIPGHIH